MGNFNQPVRIASLSLTAVGIILLSITIFTNGAMDIALPLVFLVLGAGFFILVFRLRPRWDWASFLFIPGCLSSAFGVIFLLNEVTQDWNSWAYAWLFLIAAVGGGLLLANRPRIWHPMLNPIGWGMTLIGITLFAVFGAIAGGRFIQVMAPILLVIAGVSLRWLHLEDFLPVSIFKTRRAPGAVHESARNAPKPDALIEPLSDRELEVLRLIDSGITNQQIAGRLSVAPSTVKTHINNIYGKLGVQTRVQVLNRARELGILERQRQ